ncbi:unnamed protein product [Durusdinium trenchii]|uniref:Uncharacterized protein n=1 Tax=Durusdinium trenchii TaxID=1381693 RepID=A0ABP0RVR5_9DINO
MAPKHGGSTGMGKNAQVRNKSANPQQITAEQLLREAVDRQQAEAVAPKQRIADEDELMMYKVRKRKEYEDVIRRQRQNIGSWVKYAQWEASQQEFRRARSIFERALHVEYQNVSLWLKYLEMEMKNKFVNHARNLFDRVVQLLPRVDQFWYKYAYMEELLANYAGARTIYERWMEWEPDDNPWLQYVKFEERCGELDKARKVLERYVSCRPTQQAFLRLCKFEEKHNNAARARSGFEKSVELLGNELDEKFYIKFAQFEQRQREMERAQAIFKLALDILPKGASDELYRAYVSFEKQHGDRDAIEEVVINKRRFIYEEAIAKNQRNYDVWFDYVRLEESVGDVARIRETYERAVANKPPVMQKRFWRRYIYLWIYYALFEELQTGDIEKARAVYDALLKVVPHKQFSFAKIWKLYAEFEVRQLELDRARKIYGRAIAECQKERIFLDYADLEMRLGNIDRCRTIYGKFLEVHPHNPKAWTVYVDLEDSVGEIERARALCNLAITQERLDMPELVWKRFIDLESVPPIVRARFGLEQRCAYRHADLYDEEVPEVDLETVIAKPELGAECAVKNFVLLGDQNAGKSTMLHSFCRSGDAGFMQLSSLLPILSSSFINTRMVPHSLLDDPDEPLSAIRDELPYMDTDIARGLVMLTLENFGFFCQEFGLWNPAEPTPSFLDFDPEVRFVALHFTELGGDHLDRLLRFVGSGEGLEALKKTEDIEDESFWKDMHEVLLGSLRLLRDTSCRCAFFINCTSLFCEGTLQRKALRPTLRKLKFLDEVLGGKEILFYCARTDGVPVTMFDPQRAWDEALKELAAFAAEECGRPELPLMDIMPDSALHWQPDTALDESALKEVVGEVPEEGESAPLLAWLRAFLLCMLRSLGFRLQLVALAPVRNYQASRGRQLCAASVVRNVATLLQQGCAMGDLALAQVAELLLRCAAQARRLEGDTLHCWVTRQDLATHLEDCEAEQQAVPLPEVSALSSWPKVTDVLLRAGICTAMAGEGLPQVTLELHSRDGPVVRIRAMPHETALQASSEVLFVTRGKASEATEKIPEAIGLPFDAEFFTLLTSEATIHAVATHLSFGPTEQRFAFQSPEAKEQMSSIRRRLRQELQMLLRETKKTSDAWQAEMLSEMPNSEEDELQERAQKRLCLTWGDGQAEEIAAQMRSLSEEDGLKVLIQVCDVDEPVSQEQLDNARKVWQQLLSKSHHVRVYIAYSDFEAVTCQSVEKAREALEEGQKHFKVEDRNEERAMLLEHLLKLERELGDEKSIEAAEGRQAKREKKRRLIPGGEGEDGQDAYEDYMEYVFPEDDKGQQNLKILEMARLWKKRKVEGSQ